MNKNISEIHKKICLKIKIERNKRGWTQEYLGEKCDLNRNSLSAIERNASSPTLMTLLKIAKAFEIPINELVDILKFEL